MVPRAKVPLTVSSTIETFFQFLSSSSNSFYVPQTPFNTSEQARQAVSSGQLYGALHFSRNFSAALGKRFSDGEVEDDVVDDSSVSVWLDMTSEDIYITLFS